MAVIKGQAYRVQFYVWKKADGTPYTGDASAITVRIKKDNGSLTGSSNTPSRVDATNAPGIYEIELTGTEMNADTILVAPTINDSNYQCQSITILTDKAYNAGIKAKTDKLTFSDGNYVYATAPEGVVLTSSEHDAIQGDVVTALSDQGYTVARATKLDNLDAAVSSRSTLTAQQVWEYSSRTLSSFGTLVSDIWSHSSRTLTSFGSLASDVASAVWSASTRTLTSFGSLASDVASAVWSSTTRTLTSFGSLASDVASAVWSYTIETGLTAIQWARLTAAVWINKRIYNSGTVRYRDYNDGKDRIVATEDQDGNRSITSRDGS